MLSVRISSYGCTREVWSAQKMLKRGCQHPWNKFEILWQVAQNSLSLLLSYFVAQYVLIIVVGGTPDIHHIWVQNSHFSKGPTVHLGAISHCSHQVVLQNVQLLVQNSNNYPGKLVTINRALNALKSH